MFILKLILIIGGIGLGAYAGWCAGRSSANGWWIEFLKDQADGPTILKAYGFIPYDWTNPEQASLVPKFNAASDEISCSDCGWKGRVGDATDRSLEGWRLCPQCGKYGGMGGV